MEAYYDQCGYDAERKEKERKQRIKKLWQKAYRGVLIKKKVERMFAGTTVDPTIERLMMVKMHEEPDDSPKPAASTSKKSNSNSNNSRSRFVKGKVSIWKFILTPTRSGDRIRHCAFFSDRIRQWER